MSKTLQASLAFQRRSYRTFFGACLGLVLALFLIGLAGHYLFADAFTLHLDGFFASGLTASFVFGIVFFGEDFRFMALNGVNRKTMAQSFFLNGLSFALVFTFLFLVLEGVIRTFPLPETLSFSMFSAQADPYPLPLLTLGTFVLIFFSYYAGLFFVALYQYLRPLGVLLMGLVLLIGFVTGFLIPPFSYFLIANMFIMGMDLFPNLPLTLFLLVSLLAPPLLFTLLLQRMPVRYPQ